MGKLELVWPGKNDWSKPEPRLLIEKERYRSEIAGSRSADNLLIYGENLHGLKALEKQYTGAVKCIYIDPPYNTQSSFAHYDDGMEHSAWLNMMKERLSILKRLLSKDGTIWISIDDDECHYLKVLCDEIFGRQNFIANVIWEKKYSPQNDAKWLSDSHDYILVYAKCADLTLWSKRVKKGLNLLPRTDEMNARYKNPDNDQRGLWKSSDLSVKTYSKSCDYPIKTPSGRTVNPPAGSCWRVSSERFKELLKDNRIWFGPNGNSVPSIKRFLSEVQDGIVAKTLWTRLEVGDNQEAKREVIDLNSRDVFSTPKPERLIQRILHLATNPGDLVLDCFAGSGTTGAVAHKMGRRWIMIEINGPCRTHILPRLKKVIDGTDQGGISEVVGWKGGGGFRFCEIAPSLLEKNSLNRWVVNKAYNSSQLVEALCLHMGYEFNHCLDPWWLHGKASERQFLHVIGSSIDKGYLNRLNNELSQGQSLLVYCAAFRGDPKKFPKISIKKIPKSILSKCEWGKDNYSRSFKKALQERATVKNKEKDSLVTSSERVTVPMAASSRSRS
jgi:adenine-specific DNA-methyltransferase